MKKLFLILFISVQLSSFSQQYFPTNLDVKSKNNPFIALTNATVVISPGDVIEDASILIKDGKIVEVGVDLELPKNTVIHNKSGKKFS